MKFENTNNTLKATKRDAVQVFAWKDPQGIVCTQLDSACAGFARLNITITKSDRREMEKAVESLHA